MNRKRWLFRMILTALLVVVMIVLSACGPKKEAAPGSEDVLDRQEDVQDGSADTANKDDSSADTGADQSTSSHQSGAESSSQQPAGQGLVVGEEPVEDNGFEDDDPSGTEPSTGGQSGASGDGSVSGETGSGEEEYGKVF